MDTFEPWHHWVAQFIVTFRNTEWRGLRRVWFSIRLANAVLRSKPWIDCENACDFDWVYGWVIEADCPIHDID